MHVPRDVRRQYDLDQFYQRYTHAYGIPILSSEKVRDDALKRACYVVRFMLADREDLRYGIDSEYRSTVNSNNMIVTEYSSVLP